MAEYIDRMKLYKAAENLLPYTAPTENGVDLLSRGSVLRMILDAPSVDISTKMWDGKQALKDIPDLKLCPFCGSRCVYFHDNESREMERIKFSRAKSLRTYIICHSCGVFYMNLRESDDPKLQIEEWNRRVNND